MTSQVSLLPSLEYKRFSGFKSRWAILRSWRYLTAEQMAVIICAASTYNKINLLILHTYNLSN